MWSIRTAIISEVSVKHCPCWHCVIARTCTCTCISRAVALYYSSKQFCAHIRFPAEGQFRVNYLTGGDLIMKSAPTVIRGKYIVYMCVNKIIVYNVIHVNIYCKMILIHNIIHKMILNSTLWSKGSISISDLNL